MTIANAIRNCLTGTRAWQFSNLLSLLLWFGYASLSNAEDIDPVSVFEEPSHRIIFTNDRLSVYRVDIDATEETSTLYHYHVNDQLTVVTRDSSGFDQRLGEEAGRFDAPAGTLLFTSYSVMDAKPHQIRIPAGEKFGVVGVEFFAPPAAQAEILLSPPTEAKFIIPHAAVRRLDLQGETPIAPGTLLVSLGDYRVDIERDGSSGTWQAQRGDVNWIDTGKGDITLSSSAPARLVAVSINSR